MKQIFISYRRRGGDAAAYLLYEKLTNLGYKVFYDIESLHNGRFDSKIFESIDRCHDVLVVLSPDALDRCANEGDWVREEIAYSIKNGKNIIPLFMEGFDWPSNMPEDIINLKNYNGIPLTFRFFDGVMDKIIENLDQRPLTTRVSDPEGKKRVLLWADFNNVVLDKIVKRLKMDDEYSFEELDDPINIMSMDLTKIDSIVMIVTDCTKFSNIELAIKRINQKLVNYVRNGGRLICTHDVIYRRTRNELLQEMYGCKITHFKAAEGVEYKKTEDCEGKFTSLPDEFVLHDCEICWGNLEYDVEVHFETPDGIPLVFSREYGNGVCIYLHPGDYKFNPPPSIGKPEKEFVDLLRESIKFEY